MSHAAGPFGTTRLDAVLALAFTAAGLAQIAASPIAPAAVGVAFVLGSTVPLAWRRTYPVEATVVSSAFWLIPLDGFPVLGLVVAVLYFFALGSDGSPLLAVVLAAAWATVTAVIGTLLGPEPPVAAIGSVLVVVAPVLAGRLVAHLRRQNAALVSLTRELADERRKVEAAAVGAERARIAQELHDVVGHELTLIAIQAEAATAALSVAPDRAAAPVESIRTTAHRTLAEIRTVLDVLAPGEEQSLTSADGVSDLVRRAVEAGVPARLETSGRPWPGQAPVELAVARIVRECLTNAGRHAAGAEVRLQVDWSSDRVRVTASNPSPRRTVQAGRGLTGIRHRAELLGGTCSVGVTGGRFVVDVCLPRVTAGASS